MHGRQATSDTSIAFQPLECLILHSSILPPEGDWSRTGGPGWEGEGGEGGSGGGGGGGANKNRKEKGIEDKGEERVCGGREKKR